MSLAFSRSSAIDRPPIAPDSVWVVATRCPMSERQMIEAGMEFVKPTFTFPVLRRGRPRKSELASRVIKRPVFLSIPNHVFFRASSFAKLVSFFPKVAALHSDGELITFSGAKMLQIQTNVDLERRIDPSKVTSNASFLGALGGHRFPLIGCDDQYAILQVGNEEVFIAPHLLPPFWRPPAPGAPSIAP